MHIFLKKVHSSSCFFHSFHRFSSINSINASKDYYKTLGLTNKSTIPEIKKSFYQLAKKYHPDINKGSDEKFKEINEAYEILGDENKRKEYDELRRVGQTDPSNRQQNPYYSQNPYGNSANQYNYHSNSTNNAANQQRYYYYEVKTDKGTYKKSFKQEGPFQNKHYQRRDMGLNEEIIQEFMKTFYEGKMNPNQQHQQQNKAKTHYSNQENWARNEDFMRQQGFRKDPFTYDYEDYKAYESRKEEELKRQREYEKLQREKQVMIYIFFGKDENSTIRRNL